MNSRRSWAKTTTAFLAAVLASASISALAVDSWNEAVRIDKDGKRVVELPPKGGRFPLKAPAQWDPPVPGLSYVIEGPTELVECVQPYYYGNGTCNPYSPGMYKKPRARAWVLKRGNKWLRCPDPKSDIGCVALYTNEYTPFKPQQ